MGDVIKKSPIGAQVGMVDDALGTNFMGPNATDRALAAQGDAYRTQQEELAPWKRSGLKALSGLDNNDFKFEKDAGYDFRLNEGMKGMLARASAAGGANSGATLKSLARFGQDYASNEYDKAYNRNYTRLSDLARMGYGASTGLSDAAVGYGNSVAGANIAKADRSAKFLQQGMSAGAMLLSDETTKTNIKEIKKADLDEVRKSIKAFAFNYISDENGKGDWVGIMAQDLEKTKLGKTAVFTDKDGLKKIDMKKAVSLFLATEAV